MVEVSVVIPTLNEEGCIGSCIEKVNRVFEEYGIEGEVVVSDSSTDRTPEIARSMGAKVVYPDKMGYGYAYLYGFSCARGEHIVMGDADNTYDFLEMPKLLEPLENGADMVLGSRLNGEIREGAMPWLHKYVGNPLLTRVLNLFFKAGVSDAHSGFRAFKRELLDKLRLSSSGMEFASEMIIEAARKNARIEEVPIVYHPRVGEAKLKSFSDGWRHVKFMVLRAPKYLYYTPGIALFLAGILSVVVLSTGLLGIRLHSMIAGSLLAIVGYQVIFLGLFSTNYGHSRGVIDKDSVSEWIGSKISLEKGVTAGTLIFVVSAGYALVALFRWASGGIMPMLQHDILALTSLIIGLQTIFFSFFLSLMSEEAEGEAQEERFITEAEFESKTSEKRLVEGNSLR
ncbi:MAG: glycosyltransferase family 2 protein [Archaeoglobaceae archaeon]